MLGRTHHKRVRGARIVGFSALLVLLVFGSERKIVVAEDEGEQAARLEAIEREIRKQSLALQTVVKRMRPVEQENTTSRSIDMVRIVAEGCRIVEAMDASSRSIGAPRLNEELEMIERIDSFYRVLLPAGREGWIEEDCVQPFTERRQETVVRFEDIEASDVGPFLEVAGRLFAGLSEKKAEADHIVRQHRNPATGEVTVPAIQKPYSRILRHFERAYDLHRRYIDGRMATKTETDSAVGGVNAWTEVFWGTGDYQSTGDGGSFGQNNGGTRDLSFGGGFELAPRSRVDLSFADKHEIIQTPYGSRTFDAGYDYAGEAGLHLNAGVKLDSYDDDLNDRNDFDRFTLSTKADYRVGRTTELGLDYNYLDHGHVFDNTNSFDAHRMRASVNHRLSPASRVIVAARTNRQDSIAAIHHFTDFEPSFTWERGGNDSRLSLKTLYQSLSFADVELKNFNRLAFQLLKRSFEQGGNRSADLMVTWKDFPQNDLQSYFQFRGRFSSARHGARSSYFTPSFYTNLFPHNSSVNFSEARVDVGGSSRSFYSNVSGYFQLWHSPGDPSEGAVRPHVFDLNAKLGANSANFRAGPTVGVHALISSEDGIGFFRRDGNLFRLGGFFEGRIPLPRRGELTLNGGYDHGFVYSEELNVDQSTGQFSGGELFQRHPTTLQINGMLTIPLPSHLELLGRFNFYRIDTDIDNRLSINPITRNRRLIIVFGLRYRFNS